MVGYPLCPVPMVSLSIAFALHEYPADMVLPVSHPPPPPPGDGCSCTG